MKKYILTTIALTATSAMTAFGQGSFNFGNTFDSARAIMTGDPSNPSPINSFVGSDYSVAFYWANGFGAAEGSLSLLPATITAFFGATGGGPTVDGAGLFDIGTVNLAAATGQQITGQVVAWYNGGQYATYADALAAGVNVGRSTTFDLTLATGVIQPPNLVNMNAFSVSVVPEPATYALLAFGVGAFALIRRRKV
jgi:hypothetical protein